MNGSGGEFTAAIVMIRNTTENPVLRCGGISDNDSFILIDVTAVDRPPRLSTINHINEAIRLLLEKSRSFPNVPTYTFTALCFHALCTSFSTISNDASASSGVTMAGGVLFSMQVRK